MLGPLCNQTVSLKSDSKTLYYSTLKLKYSPSILKHNKGYKKYALLNNSHNNCHGNYMNGLDISTIHVFRLIFVSCGMHAMNYFVSLGIFMCHGCRTRR